MRHPHTPSTVQAGKPDVSQLISTLLVAVAVITPLIVVPFSNDYFYRSKAIFLYLLTVIMLVVGLYRQKKFHVEKDAINILLFVYLVLVLLATCFSTDIRISILGRSGRRDGIFTIYSYAVLFLFARYRYRYQRKHLAWLITSTMVVAVYGIFQHFGLDPIPSLQVGAGVRTFATFGNPDFFGAYLSMVFPLSWFAYLATKDIRYLGVVALLFLCVLYVSTRSTWIALAFGALLLLWFVYSYSLKLSKKALLLSLLVFTLLFAGVYHNDGGSMMNRLQSIVTDAVKVINQTEDYEKAGAGRIYIWTHVWELIKERPWLGYGPETLGEVFLGAYRDDMLEHLHQLYLFDKAHNEYLHIAVTTGIPSALCYLGFLFFCCRQAWRKLWRSYWDRQKLKKQEQGNLQTLPIRREDLITAGLLIAVVTYCVQAAMNISVVSVGYLFWILLGLMVNKNLIPSEKPRKSVKSGR
ncbi:MAG TPA: O-antigen ligase family protein [Bacillota bacterium]|nr:O-antigen ligase family protein [Bacillota bacterium]